MSINRITAIVPPQVLGPLEDRLRELGVPGITVEPVRGYGEHPNFFSPDLMREHLRLILYCRGAMTGTIVDAIAGCMQHCQAPTGILSVETIARLVDLRSGKDLFAGQGRGSAPG